jgi:uncharacterized OB-fold protein
VIVKEDWQSGERVPKLAPAANRGQIVLRCKSCGHIQSYRSEASIGSCESCFNATWKLVEANEN